jgi:hypothetical protein
LVAFSIEKVTRSAAVRVEALLECQPFGFAPSALLSGQTVGNHTTLTRQWERGKD